MTKIFDIKLYDKGYKELFGKITKFDIQQIVFTPNPEILLKTIEDEEFKNLLLKANFLTIDWIGIYLWLQIKDFKLFKNKKINALFVLLTMPYFIFNIFFRKNFLYKKYWERICWSDLTNDLVKYAQKNNIKIIIIDPYYPEDLAKVESQKNFRTNLLKKFPKLNFDFFIYKENEKNNIIQKIKNSKSQILFSTLWMKKQEKSVIEIMKNCNNIKVWLAIWSSFDYFVWFQKRAPKFLRTLWFEWLYRLISWPQKIKRLKRLYNATFVFIYKVFKKHVF